MRKIIILSLLMVGCTLHAEPLTIYGTKLEITNTCKIKATNKKGVSSTIKPDLPESNNCKFIKYDDTNIIHLEHISTAYMVLVESTEMDKEVCISTHTAIVVKKDGDVIKAGSNMTSGTCHIDREQKLFHYFAHEMKLIK